MHFSVKHVPSFVSLFVGMLPGFFGKVGTIRRWDCVNDGIDMNHARGGVNLAENFNAFDGHAAESTFELGVSSFGERIHPLHVGGGGRKKCDFVDGSKKARGLCAREEMFGD